MCEQVTERSDTPPVHLFLLLGVTCCPAVLATAARHVESEGVQGSCTACILTVNKDTGRLQAATLGDSGFLIVGPRSLQHGELEVGLVEHTVCACVLCCVHLGAASGASVMRSSEVRMPQSLLVPKPTCMAPPWCDACTTVLPSSSSCWRYHI